MLLRAEPDMGWGPEGPVSCRYSLQKLEIRYREAVFNIGGFNPGLSPVTIQKLSREKSSA